MVLIHDKGVFKYHITQFRPFADPCPCSLNNHFRGNPPPPIYHFLSLMSRHILTFFMRFITFLVVLVHKFYILVVISLIGKNTHPPFPTYHSIITLEAKPPPPLSLSDMIFERSLM